MLSFILLLSLICGVVGVGGRTFLMKLGPSLSNPPLARFEVELPAGEGEGGDMDFDDDFGTNASLKLFCCCCCCGFGDWY